MQKSNLEATIREHIPPLGKMLVNSNDLAKDLEKEIKWATSNFLYGKYQDWAK